MKDMGGHLSYLLGVEKTVLESLRVFSLKRSTTGAFCNYTFDRQFVLELATFGGEKSVKPNPRNRILVPLQGSF